MAPIQQIFVNFLLGARSQKDNKGQSLLSLRAILSSFNIDSVGSQAQLSFLSQRQWRDSGTLAGVTECQWVATQGAARKTEATLE